MTAEQPRHHLLSPARASRRGPALLTVLLSSCVAFPATAQAPATTEAEATDAEGALELDTIIVTATGNVTEGTGSYVADAPTTSATGLPISPRETPQSISIVTQQQILDQNAQTLTDVVDFATGVTAAQGNGEMRWSYYARGFSIDNIQYDGVPSFVHWYARDVNAQDDMAMYDRVEFVRGATGLLEGAGNPSASINLVRKRPLDERQITMDAQASSFGNALVTFDASSPLNEEGTVRGRFIASGVAGDGQRDGLSRDYGLLYGVVDVDLSDRTTASLGMSYQRENIDGYSWGGFPTQPNGEFLDAYTPRSSPSLPWEYSDRTTTIGYLNIDHQLDNGWTLSAAGRASDGESDMLSSYMVWYPGDVLTREGGLFDYQNESYSLDARASGPVTLFGREHELVFGASGNRDFTSYFTPSGYSIVIPDPADLGTPDGPRETPYENALSGKYRQQQYGIYGAGRFTVTDQLKLIAGGRLSWYETSSNFGAGYDGYSVSAEPIPYVGVVYDINETYTVYASYTGIFTPTSSVGPSGQLLDPIVGDSYEAGVKAAFLGGRFGATAAVFQMNQTGLANALPPNECDPGIPSCANSEGEIQTKGFEVEVTGAITEAWNLAASYTYAESEYTEGANAGDLYNTAYYPKHLGKITTTYRMPGALSKLTIGGGIRAQSEVYNEGISWSDGTAFRIEQPAYAVVDAMARYQLTDATQIQLNIDNLLDEKYYTAIGETGYGNFIGAERNFTVALRHTF